MDLDFEASPDDHVDKAVYGSFDAYKAVDEHNDLSKSWPIDHNPHEQPAANHEGTTENTDYS